MILRIYSNFEIPSPEFVARQMLGLWFSSISNFCSTVSYKRKMWMHGSEPSSNSLSSASERGKPSWVSHIGAPTHPLSNPIFTQSSNVISVIFLLPMACRFRLPLCIYLIPVIRKPLARLAVLPCTPSAWKKWVPRQAVFSLAVVPVYGLPLCFPGDRLKCVA